MASRLCFTPSFSWAVHLFLGPPPWNCLVMTSPVGRGRVPWKSDFEGHVRWRTRRFERAPFHLRGYVSFKKKKKRIVAADDILGKPPTAFGEIGSVKISDRHGFVDTSVLRAGVFDVFVSALHWTWLGWKTTPLVSQLKCLNSPYQKSAPKKIHTQKQKQRHLNMGCVDFSYALSKQGTSNLSE